MQTIILWRVAVGFVQDGTVGRTCESAPTVGYHKFEGAKRLRLCDDDTFSTAPYVLFLTNTIFRFRTEQSAGVWHIEKRWEGLYTGDTECIKERNTLYYQTFSRTPEYYLYG